LLGTAGQATSKKDLAELGKQDSIETPTAPSREPLIIENFQLSIFN
jgi:hypothetical protein